MYVPQLKRHLISVGTLEALGHGVFVRDGVLDGGVEGHPTQ